MTANDVSSPQQSNEAVAVVVNVFGQTAVNDENLVFRIIRELRCAGIAARLGIQGAAHRLCCQFSGFVVVAKQGLGAFVCHAGARIGDLEFFKVEFLDSTGEGAGERLVARVWAGSWDMLGLLCGSISGGLGAGVHSLGSSS